MTWQDDLGQLVTDGHALCRQLQLDPAQLGVQDDLPFAVRVPRSFVARMQPGCADDPLLRQVLATTDELQAAPGFSNDPLQEQSAMPVPGLLHKYPNRVLLVIAGSCAINCRFCFRRQFPYQQAALPQRDWDRWWAYIASDPNIDEVILSGGDPLMLSDAVLAKCFGAMAAIPQVQRIRIHTRLPVVIPKRLTNAFIQQCQAHRVVLVLHVNHAHELNDDGLVQRLAQLRQAGVHVLNQGVLLAGVNDDAKTQVALSKALWQCGVMPYYLHVLDPVAGATHFLVSDAKAIAIHRQMQRSLPGYLVPKLVREQADTPHKVWINGH